MSHIDISRSHCLGRQGARRSAEEIAEQLDQEFDLSYRWEGDVLHFQRSGVDGHMEVTDVEVRIRCRLGLLLRPLRGRLENEIERYLDEFLT